MPKMPRGHVVRELSADALKTLVIDAPLDVQADRFARGLICLGAFDGEVLVGVNWLARGQYDEDEVDVRFLLPDDAAWDTGLWIREDRRPSPTTTPARFGRTSAWAAKRSARSRPCASARGRSRRAQGRQRCARGRGRLRSAT